jgi:hypothetical protein
MPPTTGTRTSTRQGRATVRPTNYYARTFAGRLAASGLEQTPEDSNSAPGFLPALTHFTGAVDSFPKEIINHFSMFKEVEAKLHDPEQMLKELFHEIAQLPVTTKGQLCNGEHESASAGSGTEASHDFESGFGYRLTDCRHFHRALQAFRPKSRPYGSASSFSAFAS